MSGRIEGKVILVTGAASGIGAACVERCAREGAIVACADRQPIDDAAAWLHVPGAQRLAVDVSDEASVEAKASSARTTSGA